MVGNLARSLIGLLDDLLFYWLVGFIGSVGLVVGWLVG